MKKYPLLENTDNPRIVFKKSTRFYKKVPQFEINRKVMVEQGGVGDESQSL